MLHIDQSHNGHEISVAKLDTFELSLDENPTTGYRWQIKSAAEPVCKLIGTEFEPGSGAPGRGGLRRWRFQVVATGVARLHLAYVRSFEPDKPPARTFSLTVRSVE